LHKAKGRVEVSCGWITRCICGW